MQILRAVIHVIAFVNWLQKLVLAIVFIVHGLRMLGLGVCVLNLIVAINYYLILSECFGTGVLAQLVAPQASLNLLDHIYAHVKASAYIAK